MGEQDTWDLPDLEKKVEGAKPFRVESLLLMTDKERGVTDWDDYESKPVKLCKVNDPDCEACQ